MYMYQKLIVICRKTLIIYNIDFTFSYMYKYLLRSIFNIRERFLKNREKQINIRSHYCQFYFLHMNFIVSQNVKFFISLLFIHRLSKILKVISFTLSRINLNMSLSLVKSGFIQYFAYLDLRSNTHHIKSTYIYAYNKIIF